LSTFYFYHPTASKKRYKSGKKSKLTNVRERTNKNFSFVIMKKNQVEEKSFVQKAFSASMSLMKCDGTSRFTASAPRQHKAQRHHPHTRPSIHRL
jgi:hypothetical protein